MESELSMTYKNLLTKLPNGIKVVEESYNAMQKIVKEMADYIMVRNRCHSNCTELQIRFVESIDSICGISSPNPMFDQKIKPRANYLTSGKQ